MYYNQPTKFVLRGIQDLQSYLESYSSHWTTRTSVEGTLTPLSLFENIVVRHMIKHRGYKHGHGLGRHHQGDINCIEGRLCRWCAGLGTNRADRSVWTANKPVSSSSMAT